MDERFWPPEEARKHAGLLREEIMLSVRQGRAHELTPFTGQSAGLIHEVLPATEIVRNMVAEAKAALERAGASLTNSGAPAGAE